MAKSFKAVTPTISATHARSPSQHDRPDPHVDAFASDVGTSPQPKTKRAVPITEPRGTWLMYELPPADWTPLHSLREFLSFRGPPSPSVVARPPSPTFRPPSPPRERQANSSEIPHDQPAMQSKQTPSDELVPIDAKRADVANDAEDGHTEQLSLQRGPLHKSTRIYTTAARSPNRLASYRRSTESYRSRLWADLPLPYSPSDPRAEQSRTHRGGILGDNAQELHEVWLQVAGAGPVISEKRRSANGGGEMGGRRWRLPNALATEFVCHSACEPPHIVALGPWRVTEPGTASDALPEDVDHEGEIATDRFRATVQVTTNRGLPPRRMAQHAGHSGAGAAGVSTAGAELRRPLTDVECKAEIARLKNVRRNRLAWGGRRNLTLATSQQAGRVGVAERRSVRERLRAQPVVTRASA